MIITAFPSFT